MTGGWPRGVKLPCFSGERSNNLPVEVRLVRPTVSSFDGGAGSLTGLTGLAAAARILLGVSSSSSSSSSAGRFPRIPLAAPTCRLLRAPTLRFLGVKLEMRSLKLDVVSSSLAWRGGTRASSRCSSSSRSRSTSSWILTGSSKRSRLGDCS